MTHRNVYIVLNPRSLAYANYALESLFRNSVEPLRLNLVTDAPGDKQQLEDAVARLSPASHHRWLVRQEDELADEEASRFALYPNLRAFRHGHPCWRKITDPLLLAQPGEELILLDPDLYFPNRFRFEETPADGLLLMWQKPNCLLPSRVVKAAIQAQIPLAHHVDIGVAHWRASANLDWIDWMIGKIGGASLPHVMHVEAIVWAAIAMRMGGGYLDPHFWLCWHRTQRKRALKKLGFSGTSILRSEPFAGIKCFHAGGEAKYWLPEAKLQGLLDRGTEQLSPGNTTPFVELTPKYYAREQRLKRILHRVGYYQISGSA